MILLLIKVIEAKILHVLIIRHNSIFFQTKMSNTLIKRIFLKFCLNSDWEYLSQCSNITCYMGLKPPSLENSIFSILHGKINDNWLQTPPPPLANKEIPRTPPFQFFLNPCTRSFIYKRIKACYVMWWYFSGYSDSFNR